MTHVVELDSASLTQHLAAHPGGVIVDFWGQWCKRCLHLRPQLEQLAGEVAELGWSVVAVNAESEDAAREAFDVRSLPTIVICMDGKEVERLTGSVLASTIEEQIHRWTPSRTG